MFNEAGIDVRIAAGALQPAWKLRHLELVLLTYSQSA